MEKSNPEILNEIPQAAQSHLNMLQAIIQRMSANSASCKTWAITLVSGLVVVLFSGTNRTNVSLLPVVLIPILLFFLLDAYYLALEKRFRESHNAFIKKMHSGSLTVSDLFVMTPSGNFPKALIKSVRSFSVWPFYIALLLLFIIFYFYIK